jgi:hypothetical protein
MKKLLLLSIVLAPIVIGVRTAKMANPRRGLKKCLTQLAIFHALYMIYLLFIWGRLNG